MKQLLIISFLAVLAACSSEQSGFEAEPPVAIAFATDASGMTRADVSPETNTTGLDRYHDDFFVWGDNFLGSTLKNHVFNKNRVTHSGNSWTTDVERFWDQSASYNFYAAAPADDKWTMSDDHVLSYANLTLSGQSLAVSSLADADALPDAKASFRTLDNDLMVGLLSNFSYADCANGVATIKFNHLLSRLNITVKASDDLLAACQSVQLNGITLSNLYWQGSFNGTTPFTQAGSYANWTPSGDKDPVSRTNEITLTAHKKVYYQALVIPQALAYEAIGLKGTGATEPMITITYTLNDSQYFDYSETVYLSYNLAQCFGGNTGNNISLNEGWMNTLHVTITPKEILFTPEVTPWTDGGDTQVNVE